MGDSESAPDAESPTPTTVQVDVWQRTSMAAERTWLAWWRTGLAASAGALAVGRVAPQVLHVASWPYVVLGSLFGVLAIGLLIAGPRRQAELERAMRVGEHRPLAFAS